MLVCLGMAILIVLVTLEVVDLAAGAGIFAPCLHNQVYVCACTLSSAGVKQQFHRVLRGIIPGADQCLQHDRRQLFQKL